MFKTLKIFFPEKRDRIEDIIIELAPRLRRNLGSTLVGIESFDGCDGENMKIIVREKTWDVMEKIMEIIWAVEVEKNIEGRIFPSIEGLYE